MNKRGFLATVLGVAFAAASAGFLSNPVRAQDQDPDTATAEPVSYRHPTLASNSTKPVGIQLVLNTDISGSISDEEYGIELKATAQALNSELVRSSIKYKSGDKSVAIAFIDFDDRAEMRIPWVDIRGDEINDKPYMPATGESSAAPDKLDALADEITNLPRRSSGSTSIQAGTELAETLYPLCPWKATERRVLDVFGDGSSNAYGQYISENYALGMEGELEASRDRLAAMGVTINGFAIVNEEQNLEDYYRAHLATLEYLKGPDGLHSEAGRVWAVARTLQSQGNEESNLTSFFGDVTKGMKQKISVEVASLDDYKKVLAALHQMPARPVPAMANNKTDRKILLP